MANKELASKRLYAYMRRIEDGDMHKRRQKNKHMRGNYLDTLTQRKTSLPLDGNTADLSGIDPRIEFHRTQPNRTRT